jgi:hypothetical protein
LQQQNALLQQQNAVQAAVQQTTALVQAASQLNEGVQSGVVPNLIGLQQQQSALEIALQKTSVLLQAGYRNNPALSALALRQQNTLQTAIQQTIALEGALPTPNSRPNAYQLQTLAQEQNSLMGLLTTQAPPLSGRRVQR